MQNITELMPSKELLTQWEAKEIGWEAFRKEFTSEMRTEYRKTKSRLKEIMTDSLVNNITLHLPELASEQTYHAILEQFINDIWQGERRTDHVINLAAESVEVSYLAAANQDQMKRIATKCDFFSPTQLGSRSRTCQHCDHLDQQVYMCLTTDQVVVHYEWTTPVVDVHA